MNVAVVGATGMVGQVMLKVLEEQNFPVGNLIPVASERSAGREIRFRGKNYPVVMPAQAVSLRPQLALFSAGAAFSREWAPRFAAAGCRVVDNSSAWRMEEEIPLIVPEVNGETIGVKDYIIANPNCSTIQLVVTLFPLHMHYGLKRVIVSTYQSVTGSGMRGVNQLMAEREGREAPMVYPHPIDMNIIPQGGHFLESGYTTEEQKLLDESRKIMDIPDLRLSATVVRVPVKGGHSESVNIELENEFSVEAVRSLLAASPGIRILDDPAAASYPMPLYSEGKDEVFVGRIRRDDSAPNSLNLWIVSDNLRKGAATNAVQIAQQLQRLGIL